MYQMVTSISIDYFPYGKVVREYVGTDKERYLTTQHERDEETGLDYRLARLYDSDIARFLSLDEMQNQRMSLTPYNYVSGNPIMRVDPDGRLDDLYTVDKDGNVKKEKETDQDYDMLYAKEDWDNKVFDKGIRVNDQGILDQLSKPANSYAKHQAEGDVNELHKTFMFLAENTNVEWGVSQFNLNAKNTNVLGTFGIYNGTNKSPTIVAMYPNSNIQDSDIQYTLHNHPNSNAHGTERSSMGQFGNGEISGDLYYVRERVMRNGGRDVYPTYVYFANTRNLYNVTSKGPKYIRKIDTNMDFLYRR